MAINKVAMNSMLVASLSLGACKSLPTPDPVVLSSTENSPLEVRPPESLFSEPDQPNPTDNGSETLIPGKIVVAPEGAITMNDLTAVQLAINRYCDRLPCTNRTVIIGTNQMPPAPVDSRFPVLAYSLPGEIFFNEIILGSDWENARYYTTLHEIAHADKPVNPTYLPKSYIIGDIEVVAYHGLSIVAGNKSGMFTLIEEGVCEVLATFADPTYMSHRNISDSSATYLALYRLSQGFVNEGFVTTEDLATMIQTNGVGDFTKKVMGKHSPSMVRTLMEVYYRATLGEPTESLIDIVRGIRTGN